MTWVGNLHSSCTQFTSILCNFSCVYNSSFMESRFDFDSLSVGLWTISIIRGCRGILKMSFDILMHDIVHLPVTVVAHEWMNNIQPQSTHAASCVGRSTRSVSYVVVFGFRDFKALEAPEKCVVYTCWLWYVCCFEVGLQLLNIFSAYTLIKVFILSAGSKNVI